MRYVHDDGGRSAAGFKGKTGDCVVRAIAIAAQVPYLQVYDDLNRLALNEKPHKSGRVSHARTGVRRQTYHPYILSLGGVWTPTMQIGSGCQVHLRDHELPSGRLIARVTRHVCAVIDGVIHDEHDPSRGGTRCCYGYYQF